jgi:hypothetical protein
LTWRVRAGIGLLVLLGAFIFLLLTVGSLGDRRPELTHVAVSEVVGGAAPAERFGREEVRIAGWYAELDADCTEAAADAAPAVAWLERTCPLRVLMPYQPEASVTQRELEAAGLRLTSETGAAFPSRARPEGPNLRLQQLVFVGHFEDAAAASCAPARRERCRNTFVVSDYDGLIR